MVNTVQYCMLWHVAIGSVSWSSFTRVYIPALGPPWETFWGRHNLQGFTLRMSDKGTAVGLKCIVPRGMPASYSCGERASVQDDSNAVPNASSHDIEAAVNDAARHLHRIQRRDSMTSVQGAPQGRCEVAESVLS
jgi:hypothetical protein